MSEVSIPATPPPSRKTCRHCAQPIYATAVVCHHCSRHQTPWRQNLFPTIAALVSVGALILSLWQARAATDERQTAEAAVAQAEAALGQALAATRAAEAAAKRSNTALRSAKTTAEEVLSLGREARNAQDQARSSVTQAQTAVKQAMTAESTAEAARQESTAASRKAELAANRAQSAARDLESLSRNVQNAADTSKRISSQLSRAQRIHVAGASYLAHMVTERKPAMQEVYARAFAVCMHMVENAVDGKTWSSDATASRVSSLIAPLGARRGENILKELDELSRSTLGTALPRHPSLPAGRSPGPNRGGNR